MVRGPTIFARHVSKSHGGHLKQCGTDTAQDKTTMPEVQPPWRDILAPNLLNRKNHNCFTDQREFWSGDHIRWSPLETLKCNTNVRYADSRHQIFLVLWFLKYLTCIISFVATIHPKVHSRELDQELECMSSSSQLFSKWCFFVCFSLFHLKGFFVCLFCF